MEAAMSESAFAVLGLFDSADALMKAIPAVRARGLGRLEAYTPYPIHGMDDALGLRRSPLGGMVLAMGILGALTALGFQYWISAIDYPIVTGGKPPGSWEALVPVMFEVTVLFATFTAGLGMLLLLNRLPFFGHPVLSSQAIKGITRDRFALSVEADAGPLDAAAAREALAAAGAAQIEVLPGVDRRPFLTSDYVLRTLGGIFAACIVSGLLMYGAVKLFPVLPPMVHMLDQPRLNPQKADRFFKDGHGMQMPVAGTVARGYLPVGVTSQEAAAALVNPLPRTKDVFALGRESFRRRCAVCHGALADGVGSLTAAYGAKPANLQARLFQDYPDGKIYWVIVMGKNAMPSHAADLSETQRWAVVHYVRALQRAQNAKDEDLKVEGQR
jgi:mono/diheme cytochrome c family protein